MTRDEINEFFHGNKDAKVEVTDGIVDVNSIGFPAKYHVAAEELKLGEITLHCIIGERLHVKTFTALFSRQT